ncbi:Uncharacterised protein [uncultured archaeon]|nr:Uncharacterised protein [uncultured archaeon]
MQAKIAAVVHGPEIIDSGLALQLINYLKKFGSVSAVLGGTMGRVAVLDAGLEDIIDICSRKRPSLSVQELEPTSDIIFLLNQAKSRETALAFGSMVAAAAGVEKPFIQIDCGGKFVAGLSGNADELVAAVASDLKFDTLRAQPLPGPFSRGGSVRRTLSGAYPGELISVNGTVVARATGSSVEIEAKDGRIVQIRGAAIKPHGLEKLNRVGLDLGKAIVRSGSIRRTQARARRAPRESEGSGAVFIDHCAEDAFEMAKWANVALTVGDDTTAIAGDILFRLGRPVIGIVDGDLDRLAGKCMILPGSVIIRVEPGHDDIVGKRVRTEIFHESSWARVEAGELARRAIMIAGERVVRIERF